jgi:two-component system response regulator FixJ
MATVLIVDGDDLVRDSVTRVLGRVGHDVIELENRAAVRSVCEQTAPHVVILEIAMADRKDLQLISELRDHFPNTAVIAMSGGRWHQPDPAKRAGAVDVLEKPFDDVELIEMVEQSLAPGP